jgi:hypothetical protein
MMDMTEGQLPDWLRTEILYLDGNPDYKVPPSALMLLGDAADALDRLATLETALRTIQSAVPKYLKKEMTAEEFALVVIGEADSDRVNKALENSR